MNLPTISGRVAALGHRLPSPVQQNTPFLLWQRSGNLVFISGQVSRFNDRHVKGMAGGDLNLDELREAALLCGLNMLFWLSKAVDDRAYDVVKCVRMAGVIACAPQFLDHSSVIGAASQLMVDMFGAAGRHARIATGAPSLPFGYAVTIEAQFEVRD